jgi:hypothetical protein
MIFKSASITLTSPWFVDAVVKSIESFDNDLTHRVPLWQTIKWAEFLLSANQIEECIFIGMHEVDDILSGYALVQIRSIGLGNSGAFVVGGPNFLNTLSPQARELLLSEIDRILTTRWVVFVQYEPIQDLGFTSGIPTWKNFVEPYTLMLDLTLPEDEILAQMKQKGRYNIKLAEKQGVSIEQSTSTEGLDEFMRLLSETLDRDGFSGNSRAYYAGLLASRTHPGEGLYLSRREGRVIAAAILVISGHQAIYYYGASTSDNELRKYMPAYLLQWRMIQIAKSLGCTQYDFLWIAPSDRENHPLAGVSDFKHKFGGKIFSLPSKSMMIYRLYLYTILVVVRKIRWFFVK